MEDIDIGLSLKDWQETQFKRPYPFEDTKAVKRFCSGQQVYIDLTCDEDMGSIDENEVEFLYMKKANKKQQDIRRWLVRRWLVRRQ